MSAPHVKVRDEGKYLIGIFEVGEMTGHYFGTGAYYFTRVRAQHFFRAGIFWGAQLLIKKIWQVTAHTLIFLSCLSVLCPPTCTEIKRIEKRYDQSSIVYRSENNCIVMDF